MQADPISLPGAENSPPEAEDLPESDSESEPELIPESDTESDSDSDSSDEESDEEELIFTTEEAAINLQDLRNDLAAVEEEDDPQYFTL